MTGIPASVWAALLLLAAALGTWPSRREALSRRAGRLRVAPASPPPTRPDGSGRLRRWVLAAAAGAAMALLVGGGTGVVAAVVVSLGGERALRRAEPDADAADRAARVRDLPVACDLVSVCLAAGMPIGAAVGAVGEALPGPLGRQLRTVAAHSRLGTDVRTAWSGAPAELAALGRVLVRAGESGSAAVPALRVLAAESRAGVRASTESAVRRAGVWVLAPLGACFLPAFLCLGVVPLVLGIARDVFG